MKKQIEVEDFGATLAAEIIKLSDAVESSPITIRAMAILLADKTGLSLTQCRTLLQSITELKQTYVKANHR